MEWYITGVGQRIQVHERGDCKGPHCVIHNPSQHHMRGWRTLWRDDRYLMERVCVHGVGHPDPDCIAYTKDSGEHGCDGCCMSLTSTAEGAK